MADPFLGEIRMFGGNFAPRGWAFCNGQLLAIAQNDALFSLIGTTFGGDGRVTFALPNLQGRLALGEGQGPGLSDHRIGQMSGSEEVTITTASMPQHMHSLIASINEADQTDPTGHLTGTAVTGVMYTKQGTPEPTTQFLNQRACGLTGGNQPHENLMPALCVSFIISLSGIFPSRN